ncbi:MAG: HK97 family phage prohead protease [Patescibacteria group bacterium]|jgi:hypothetical protein
MAFEFKEVPLRLKAFSLTDRTFEGYISTFEEPENYDSYGDIVARGFFAADLVARGPKSADPRIKVLFNHDWDRPIGLPVEMHEDERGCYAKAFLPPDIPDADLTLKFIAAGLWDALSFMFEVTEYAFLDDYPTTHGYPVRKLIRGKTFEFSPVTFPANDNARIAKARAERKAAWLGTAAPETKEGRVLSSKNVERLSQAQTLIGEVISSASPEDGGKALNQALTELRDAVDALTTRI